MGAPDVISIASMPASSKGGGQAFAMPDVCLTPAPPSPPVPVPYPNTANLMQAKGESKKVKFVNKGALTKKSEVPRTMGAELGTQLGVTSGQQMAKMVFKKGSTKVKVEGQPCAHLGAVTGHNGTNANMPAGAQVAPSQTKVIVAP